MWGVLLLKVTVRNIKKPLRTACQVLLGAARWHFSLNGLIVSLFCLTSFSKRSGSSVNYSTSQEGKGTWWWGLGAGSQTIKPDSRPLALFTTATIPTQFHCDLPELCVSCLLKKSKRCCRSPDKHYSWPGFLCSYHEDSCRPEEGFAQKQISSAVISRAQSSCQSQKYQVSRRMCCTVVE